MGNALRVGEELPQQALKRPPDGVIKGRVHVVRVVKGVVEDHDVGLGRDVHVVADRHVGAECPGHGAVVHAHAATPAISAAGVGGSNAQGTLQDELRPGGESLAIERALPGRDAAADEDHGEVAAAEVSLHGGAQPRAVAGVDLCQLAGGLVGHPCVVRHGVGRLRLHAHGL